MRPGLRWRFNKSPPRIGAPSSRYTLNSVSGTSPICLEGGRGAGLSSSTNRNTPPNKGGALMDNDWAANPSFGGYIPKRKGAPLNIAPPMVHVPSTTKSRACVVGELTNRTSSWNGDMSRTDATWAVARFRPLCNISFFPGRARPRARGESSVPWLNFFVKNTHRVLCEFCSSS